MIGLYTIAQAADHFNLCKLVHALGKYLSNTHFISETPSVR